MAKGKELTTVLKFIGVQDKSITKTITTISKGLGKMNSMVNKAIKGTALAATALAGTAAAAATATTKALYDMGASWDKASDAIRVGTGATGQQLAELNESMQTLYKQLPQGKAEIASTIADINTLTGASGTALEAYASNALKASHMLGVDVKTIYTEASKAFNAFNIPADQMASKLDHLFKVSQATGVGIDKLAQGAVLGQASFRTLGYSFEQATSLLGQLDKAGVKTETAIAAMKKGIVSLVDKGAKDLPKAFSAIAREIQRARTETEAINIAATVFGARGGGEIAKALRDGRMSAEAFTEAMKLSGESIDVAYQDTADFSEKMQPIMHTLEVAVKPLADSVFEQINRLIPVVSGVVEKFVPIISAKASELAAKVEQGMNSVIVSLQGIDLEVVMNKIAETVVRVGDKLKELWAHKDEIAHYVVLALEIAAAIKAIYVAEKIFIAVSLGIKTIIATYTTLKAAIIATKTAIVGLKSAGVVIKTLTALQWAWNVALNANPIGLIVLAIVAVIGIAWLLYDNWDTICEWCSKAWDATCKWFRGVWDSICQWFSDKWDKFVKFWSPTVSEMGGVWDRVVSWISSAWDSTCAAFRTAWERFRAFFAPALDILKTLWSAVTSALSGDWSGACGKLQEVWQKFKDFWAPSIEILRQKWDEITSWLNSAWDSCCAGIRSAWQSFRDYVSPAMDGIKTAWDTVTSRVGTAWDKTCSGLSGAWETCRSGMMGAWDKLSARWSNITSTMSSLWDRCCNTIKSAWDGIQGGFTSAWEGIKSVAASSVDWLMDKIKPFLGVWDSVKGGVSWVANKIGLGGDEAEKTAQTQQVVEKMATGGFTRGITIAGEAGTEAVISFDPRYRKENQSYLRTAAEMLGMVSPLSQPVPGGNEIAQPRYIPTAVELLEMAAPAPVISGGTTNSTHIELGGITFSPVIQAPTPASAASILDQLRAAVPDLADLLEDELAKRAAHRYA